LPNLEATTATDVDGDARTTGLGLAARVGEHALGHAFVVNDLDFEAEVIVIPFPGFDEIVHADAHLLYAADDFGFHILNISRLAFSGQQSAFSLGFIKLIADC
jgi:hypothetical protein